MKSVNAITGPTDSMICRAAEVLRQGEVVAIPTETYYGLAVDPVNEHAIGKLFHAKKRPLNKPILLLVSAIEQIYSYTATIPELYTPLIERYWPGPLTLVFKAGENVTPLLTGGTGTIGIRLTPDPTAIRLIEAFGGPITATSANISTFEPARCKDEIQKAFGQSVKYILDGGVSSAGAGSTVVKTHHGRLCIARQGRISLPELQACPESG